MEYDDSSSGDDKDDETFTPDFSSSAKRTSVPKSALSIAEICRRRPYLIKRSDFLNVKLPSIVKFQYSVCIAPAGSSFADPLKSAVMPPEKDLEKMQKKIKQSPQSSILLPYGLFSAEGVGKFLYLHTMKKTKLMVHAEIDWFNDLSPLNQYEVLEPITQFKLNMFRDFITDNPYKKTMPITGSVEIMVEDLTSLCCDRLYVDTVIMKFISMVMIQQNEFSVYFLNGMQADLSQAGREAQASTCMKYKYIFIMHVKQELIDGKPVTSMAGVDSNEGNHFTFCVVMLDGSTVNALYVDTLGFAAPSILIQSLKQFFLGFLDNVVETGVTINLRHVHQPSTDGQAHVCNYNCSVYPKQTCQTVGGPAVLLGVALVLFCPDEFQQLINVQRSDNVCVSFKSHLGHFLPDFSAHSHYLRFCIINWFTSGEVKIENCIDHEQMILHRFAKIRKPANAESDLQVYQVEKEKQSNLSVKTRPFGVRPPHKRKSWSARQLEKQRKIDNGSSDDSNAAARDPNLVRIVPVTNVAKEKVAKSRRSRRKRQPTRKASEPPVMPVASRDSPESFEKTPDEEYVFLEGQTTKGGSPSVKENVKLVKRTVKTVDKSGTVLQLSTVSYPESQVQEIISSYKTSKGIGESSSMKPSSTQMKEVPGTTAAPVPPTSSVAQPSTVAPTPTNTAQSPVVTPAMKTGLMFTTAQGTFIAPLSDERMVEAIKNKTANVHLIEQGVGAVGVGASAAAPTIMAPGSVPDVPTPSQDSTMSAQTPLSEANDVPPDGPPVDDSTPTLTQDDTAQVSDSKYAPCSVTPTLVTPTPMTETPAQTATAPAASQVSASTQEPVRMIIEPVQIVPSQLQNVVPGQTGGQTIMAPPIGPQAIMVPLSSQMIQNISATRIPNSVGPNKRQSLTIVKASSEQDSKDPHMSELPGSVSEGGSASPGLKNIKKVYVPARFVKTPTGNKVVPLSSADKHITASTKTALAAAANALGGNLDFNAAKRLNMQGTKQAAEKRTKTVNILSRNRRTSSPAAAKASPSSGGRRSLSQTSVADDESLAEPDERTFEDVLEVCDSVGVSRSPTQKDGGSSVEVQNQSVGGSVSQTRNAESSVSRSQNAESSVSQGQNAESSNMKPISVDKLMQSVSDGATAVHEVMSSVVQGSRQVDEEVSPAAATESTQVAQPVQIVPPKPGGASKQAKSDSILNISASALPVNVTEDQRSQVPTDSVVPGYFADVPADRADMPAGSQGKPPLKKVLTMSNELIKMLQENPHAKVKLSDGRELKISWEKKEPKASVPNDESPDIDVPESQPEKPPIKYVVNAEFTVEVPEKILELLWKHPTVKILSKDGAIFLQLRLTLNVDRDAQHTSDFPCEGAEDGIEEVLGTVREYVQSEQFIEWVHSMRGLYCTVTVPRNLRSFLSVAPLLKFSPPGELILSVQVRKRTKVLKTFPCTEAGFDDEDAMKLVNNFANTDQIYRWLQEEQNIPLELDFENVTCLSDLLSRPYRVRYAEPSSLRLRCSFKNGKVVFKRFPCTSEGLKDAAAMAEVDKFVNGPEGLEWAHANGSYESDGRFEWLEKGELPVGLETKYFFDDFKFDILNSVSQTKFVERVLKNSSGISTPKSAAWGVAHRTDEEYRLLRPVPQGAGDYQVVTRKITCSGRSSACRTECGALLSEVSRDLSEQYCTACEKMLFSDEEMKTCENCGLISGCTKYWGNVQGILVCACCNRYFKKHHIMRPHAVKKRGLAGREKLLHSHLTCNWRMKLVLCSNDLTKWKVLHGRRNDFFHREEAVQPSKRPSLSQRDLWDQQILAASHATQTHHIANKLKSMGDKTVTQERLNSRLKRLKRTLPLTITSGRAAIRKRRQPDLPTVEKLEMVETEVLSSENEEVEEEGQEVAHIVKQECADMYEVTIPSMEEAQEQIQTIPQDTLATISHSDGENIVILQDHLLCSICIAQKIHPPYTCSSSGELFRHNAEVHSVKVFSCSLCWNEGNLVSFTSEQELTNHCAATHAQPRLEPQQKHASPIKVMRTEEVLHAIDSIVTADEILSEQEQQAEERDKKRTLKIDMFSLPKRVCVDGDQLRCAECGEECGNRAMCCDNCHSWYHWHCISFTLNQENSKWYCVRCIPV